MLTSPPSSSSLYAPATEFVILLGDDDGSTPTLEDEVDYLYPLTQSITATGHRDDVLTFAFLDQPRLVDTAIPVGMQRQIELRALDDDGDPTIVLGWGMMARQPQTVDDQQERVTIEARIGDQNFGCRLTSFPVFDPDAEERVNVQQDLVFNPEIDSVIRPNMSFRMGGGEDDDLWYYVLDWDSCWTEQAIEFQGGEPTRWGLIDCVVALCWWLNPDETFIQNPEYGDLGGTSAFAGPTPPIANMAIPFGSSLPQALDALLIPLEMSWYLAHTVDDDDVRTTTIKFFRRGDGPHKNVRMQRPGKYRDVTKTNVTSFDATYSVIDLANRIECYGEFEKREITVQLTKGWEISDDIHPLNALAVGGALNETNPEIGRLWVLNESAEYDGYRPESEDWAELAEFGFEQTPIVKRRRFTRCLSQHADGDDDTSNQFLVEWWDASLPGAISPEESTDTGWTKVRWPFSVLEKQCGIFFEGSTPPEPLWRLINGGNPDDACVRITATLAGDQRVAGIAERLDTSSNGLDLTLVMDVSDKFENSQVNQTGDFASIFADSPTDARDDTAAILEYAEAVQTIEDVLRLDCSIELEGCMHPEYAIGDCVHRVKGRNLSLELTPAGRAPQIVGFNWDFQGQSCELLLESFRKEKPRVVHDGGKSIVQGDKSNSQKITTPKLGAATELGSMGRGNEIGEPMLGEASEMGGAERLGNETKLMQEYTWGLGAGEPFDRHGNAPQFDGDAYDFQDGAWTTENKWIDKHAGAPRSPNLPEDEEGEEIPNR